VSVADLIACGGKPYQSGHAQASASDERTSSILAAIRVRRAYRDQQALTCGPHPGGLFNILQGDIQVGALSAPAARRQFVFTASPITPAVAAS